MAHLLSLVLNQWRPSHRKVVPLAPREAHSTSSCSAPSRTAGCKSWRDFLKAKTQRMRAFWREEQPNGGFPKTWLLQTIIGFPIDNNNFNQFWMILGCPQFRRPPKSPCQLLFWYSGRFDNKSLRVTNEQKNNWSQLYFDFFYDPESQWKPRKPRVSTLTSTWSLETSQSMVVSSRKKPLAIFPIWPVISEKCPHFCCQGGFLAGTLDAHFIIKFSHLGTMETLDVCICLLSLGFVISLLFCILYSVITVIVTSHFGGA